MDALNLTTQEILGYKASNNNRGDVKPPPLAAEDDSDIIFMYWVYPGTEPPRDTGDWKPFIKSSKPKREENLLPINGAMRPMRPLENTPATDWKPKKSGSTFYELPVPVKVENTANQPSSTAKVRATHNTQPSCNASKARKTGRRVSESAAEKPPYVCHFKGCKLTFATIGSRNRHVKTLHQAPQYQCQLCERWFARLDYWRSHFKKCLNYHCSLDPVPTPANKPPSSNPPKYLRPRRTPSPTKTRRPSPESPEVPLSEVARLKRVIDDVNSFQKGLFGSQGLQFPLVRPATTHHTLSITPCPSQSTCLESPPTATLTAKTANPLAARSLSNRQSSLFGFGVTVNSEPTSLPLDRASQSTATSSSIYSNQPKQMFDYDTIEGYRFPSISTEAYEELDVEVSLLDFGPDST